MKQTRLSRLVEDAARHVEAKASTWYALKLGNRVLVRHYSTDMFHFNLDTWTAEPINCGWGSQSDKSGVTKILEGVRASNARTYNALYDRSSSWA